MPQTRQHSTLTTLSLFCLLFNLVLVASAQLFEEQTFPFGRDYSYLYTGVETSAFGDYNSDGHLDLAISASDADAHVERTVVFPNDGSGGGATAFNKTNQFNLTAIVAGTSVLWTDYNNDGFLDLFMGGNWASGGPCFGFSSGFAKAYARLYQGDGAGYFTEVFNFGIFCGVAAAFGDFDRDGRQDLVVIGGTVIKNYHPVEAPNNGFGSPSNLTTATVWFNRGGSATAANFVPVPLRGFDFFVGNGDVCVADYDGDNWLDILFIGEYNNTRPAPITILLHNEGKGNFSSVKNHPITHVGAGACAWADFDNSGKLSVLISGYDSIFEPVTEIWKYSGGVNGFTKVTNPGLPNYGFTAARWGDFSGDGLPDLCIQGDKSPLAPTNLTLWINNGDGTFSSNSSLLFNPGGNGACVWGDVDNDNRLDLFSLSISTQSEILHNVGFPAGSAPPAPGNVHYTYDTTAATLHITWDAPTASGPLTYDVDVEGVVKSLSLPSGKRLTPIGGQTSLTSITLYNIDPTTAVINDFTVKVQSVDAAFRGSGFASMSSPASTLSSAFISLFYHYLF